jgi:DNA-binding CsgD family transcriptional regulator
MNMEINSNLEMDKKLDRVLQLLAIMTVRDMPQTDQIATLNRVGFAPKEIANVLGTTPNTVRVALVSIRRVEALGGKRRLRIKRDSGGEMNE